MRLSRLSIAAFLVFGLLALPAQAQSQRSQSQHETTVGLGISVVNWGGNEDIIGSPLSLTVPVTFSSVRFEPELGYSRYQSSSDTHTSTLHFGTGVFYLSQLEDFQFQAGARFGLRRDWQSYDGGYGAGTTSDGRTNVDYAIGPALGGEYYVGDHLSLGLEARLLYTNKDWELDDGQSRSNSIVNTEAAGYVRIHF